METHSPNTTVLDAALRAHELGYPPIPCKRKVPQVEWAIWQQQLPTRDEVIAMFANRSTCNLAVVCKDHLTVDVDDPNELDFVLENAGKSPAIRQTPSGGFHVDYRPRNGVEYGNRVDIKGREIDLRAPGKGYVIIPPSRNPAGVPYRYVGVQELLPVAELPIFKVTWSRTYRRKPKCILSEPGNDEYARRLRRAQGWLACVEGAMSGAGGHNRTMRVAGKLIQDPRFSLEYDDALALMLRWNETCEPPWTEKELRHKLDSAIKNIDKYRR